MVLVQLKYIEGNEVRALHTAEEKHFGSGNHEVLSSLLRKIFTIIGANDLSVYSRLFKCSIAIEEKHYREREAKGDKRTGFALLSSTCSCRKAIEVTSKGRRRAIHSQICYLRNFEKYLNRSSSKRVFLVLSTKRHFD